MKKKAFLFCILSVAALAVIPICYAIPSQQPAISAEQTFLSAPVSALSKEILPSTSTKTITSFQAQPKITAVSVQESLYQAVQEAVSQKRASLTYDFEKSISAATLKKLSDNALNRVRREYPQYYLSNSNSFTYTSTNPGLYDQVTFNLTYFPLTQAEIQQIEDEITQIVSQADGSTVDKLRFFHDTILDRTTYDYTAAAASSREYPNAFHAYGALIDGKAVCQGYAAAFKMLCDKAGIPTWIVTGETDVPHAWNYVKLDGKYYLIDCTKDDTGNENQRYIYFLAGADTTAKIFKQDGSAPGFLSPTGYSEKSSSDSTQGKIIRRKTVDE